MAKAATPKAPLPPMSSYLPPQPAFSPCPDCGVLVLLRQGERRTPVQGLAHVCQEKEQTQ